jgi:hypothetical protein
LELPPTECIPRMKHGFAYKNPMVAGIEKSYIGREIEASFQGNIAFQVGEWQKQMFREGRIRNRDGGEASGGAEGPCLTAAFPNADANLQVRFWRVVQRVSWAAGIGATK